MLNIEQSAQSTQSTPSTQSTQGPKSFSFIKKVHSETAQPKKNDLNNIFSDLSLTNQAPQTNTIVAEKKFNFIKSKNDPTQKIENLYENISNIVNNTNSGLITVDLTKRKI